MDSSEKIKILHEGSKRILHKFNKLTKQKPIEALKLHKEINEKIDKEKKKGERKKNKRKPRKRLKRIKKLKNLRRSKTSEELKELKELEELEELRKENARQLAQVDDAIKLGLLQIIKAQERFINIIPPKEEYDEIAKLSHKINLLRQYNYIPQLKKILIKQRKLIGTIKQIYEFDRTTTLIQSDQNIPAESQSLSSIFKANLILKKILNSDLKDPRELCQELLVEAGSDVESIRFSKEAKNLAPHIAYIISKM